MLVVVISAGGSGGSKHEAPPVPTVPVATGAARVGTTPAFTVPGGAPAGMAVGGSRLWVAVPSRGRLLGLTAGGAATSVDVGGAPQAVAIDVRRRVWVTGPGIARSRCTTRAPPARCPW